MERVGLHRKSEEWVKVSLIVTVTTVLMGTIGFAIQITNLTRIYEQRQTTVEVKLQSIERAIDEIRQTQNGQIKQLESIK
jgi:predicted PurR-regulated permease PerM